MFYARTAMYLSQASKTAADPLSDVLAALGARSVRRTRLEAAGDWAMTFPARARLKFVAVLRGECWILLPDQQPLRLTAGDTFLIGNTAYTMTSEPGIVAVDGTARYAGPDGDVVRLGGEDTVILGGGIAFADEEANFLLDALPPFMRIEANSPSASAVSRTLDLLEAEMGRVRLGGTLITARLAEILLVEAIRAYVAERGDEGSGWIGALADRRIGEALHLMHRDIAYPWTIEAMAKRVGMSRSAFSALFTRRVGRPPLEYLTHWRMTVARQALKQREADVSGVAIQVGYASQSAFSQAFKRIFGYSPRRSGGAASTRSSKHKKADA
jgi:AraC-like DNA-binding protein